MISKNTQHTLSLLNQWLKPHESLLDIGCDKADIAHHLQKAGHSQIFNIDFVDTRQYHTTHFSLYDGVHIPLPDKSVDWVSLNFVLHHVDNQKKPLLLAEVKRVCKGHVFILEDTPSNPLDWCISHLHGHYHRFKINSTEGFGFFSQKGWETYLQTHGFQIVASQRLSRFCRNRKEPYARSLFVLKV